jgi:hypothetical protein
VRGEDITSGSCSTVRCLSTKLMFWEMMIVLFRYRWGRLSCLLGNHKLLYCDTWCSYSCCALLMSLAFQKGLPLVLRNILFCNLSHDYWGHHLRWSQWRLGSRTYFLKICPELVLCHVYHRLAGNHILSFIACKLWASLWLNYFCGIDCRYLFCVIGLSNSYRRLLKSGNLFSYTCLGPEQSMNQINCVWSGLLVLSNRRFENRAWHLVESLMDNCGSFSTRYFDFESFRSSTYASWCCCLNSFMICGYYRGWLRSPNTFLLSQFILDLLNYFLSVILWCLSITVNN